MNFGIGVCIGDVSFTSRPYSTHIGSSNQRIAESNTKNHAEEENKNTKGENKFSQRCKTVQRHLASKPPSIQDINPSRQFKEKTNDNVTSSSSKSGTGFPYICGKAYEDNKSENEYSSTPSRASLRKHESEHNVKIQGHIGVRTNNTDGSSILQTRRSNDCVRITDAFSKSKWQLVAERLKSNRQPVSTRQSIFDGQQKNSSLNPSPRRISPNPNTSYQPYEDPYYDCAKEIKTNSQPPPVTLLDPSVFYITASKFCPCDHHDQLRRIREHKIALARKARKKDDRLRRKELRRTRKSGSLSLSRSSSESTSSLGKVESNILSPVDILPSIPSLTIPSSECDEEDYTKSNYHEKSNNTYREYENQDECADNRFELKEDVTHPSVDISQLSYPFPSESSESGGQHDASKVASTVLEPVILDGCESIPNKHKVKRIATGNKRVTTKLSQNNKVIIISILLFQFG